jgi:hypothetical protein
MDQVTESPIAAPAAARWLRAFGYRNVAYLAFIALLVPLGMALEASGPHGPDSGGGVMAAVMLWGAVSVGFILVNLILLVAALTKGRPAGAPLIACALPPAIVVVALMLEPVFVR